LEHDYLKENEPFHVPFAFSDSIHQISQGINEVPSNSAIGGIICLRWVDYELIVVVLPEFVVGDASIKVGAQIFGVHDLHLRHPTSGQPPR
jgi:hypothetical protein